MIDLDEVFENPDENPDDLHSPEFLRAILARSLVDLVSISCVRQLVAAGVEPDKASQMMADMRISMVEGLMRAMGDR